MRFRSIGARLTFWYTSILTLTFILLGSAAYGLLVFSLSNEMDNALNGVAEVMAQRTRGGGAPFFPSEVDAAFRRFFGFAPPDQYIDLFDPLGQRDPRQSSSPTKELSTSPQALQNAARGLPTFETLEVQGSAPVRVLTKPVFEAGRVSKLVRVGMSLENMANTRRRFLLIMASVVPFGVLLAGVGGWLLARRALRPVDHMTRTAQRISGELLGERLQVSGNGDELDRLAQTINDMLGRLDDAFLQMRQFSADASHELQTPLTILKGEMEVALRTQRDPEEYRRVLKSGLEEIDRISHLVGGLLLLARADAGVLKLDSRPVDLGALLDEVREQMRVVADEHSISLQAKSQRLVTVLGDREHLRRLLLNLVDNAIKYTPAGGCVTLSLQSDNNWASLMISDTGIGLSEDEMKQVFNRFHRVTETRSKDVRGVGLGLSIAQSIVVAHGGRIHVDSTPGQGSTFTILLPSTSA
ncbi:MAG: heavy metal sensor histidine kinase [Desulfobacterales bacterium]|nr:heavy metal sensor histidine kinase [Desulfobacterales bacterium]